MITTNIIYDDCEITIFKTEQYSTILIQKPLIESEIEEDSVPLYWIGRKLHLEELFKKDIIDRSDIEQTLIEFFSSGLVHMSELLPHEFHIEDFDDIDEDELQNPPS